MIIVATIFFLITINYLYNITFINNNFDEINFLYVIITIFKPKLLATDKADN
jgi:hypothetical protein